MSTSRVQFKEKKCFTIKIATITTKKTKIIIILTNKTKKKDVAFVTFKKYVATQATTTKKTNLIDKKQKNANANKITGTKETVVTTKTIGTTKIKKNADLKITAVVLIDYFAGNQKR